MLSQSCPYCQTRAYLSNFGPPQTHPLWPHLLIKRCHCQRCQIEVYIRVEEPYHQFDMVEPTAEYDGYEPLH